MAAPEGCGVGCGPRCQKLTVGGMWRCNLMAISGNPFCEKHYALEVKKLQDIIIGELSSGEEEEEEEEREVVFGTNVGVSSRERVAPKGSVSKGKEKVLRENDDAVIRIGGRERESPNGVKIKQEMQGEDQGGDEGNEELGADEVTDRAGKPRGSKNKEKVTRKIMEMPDGSKNKEKFPIKTEVNEMDDESNDGNVVLSHKRRRSKRCGGGQKKPVLVGTSGVRLSKEEYIGVSEDNIKKRGRGRPKKVDAKHGLNSRGDVLMEDIVSGKESRGVLSESEQTVKRSRGRSQKRGETSGARLFKEDEISVCRDSIKKRGRGRPKKVDTKHGLDTCGDDDVMEDIVLEKDIRDVPSDYEEIVKRPRGRPKKMVHG